MRVVSALIEQARKISARLKELTAPAPRKKFHMTVHDAGGCYLPNLDNSAEVLAAVEGARSQEIHKGV